MDGLGVAFFVHETADSFYPLNLANVAVVECPGSNAASATLPPQLSTSAAPTTVSRV